MKKLQKQKGSTDCGPFAIAVMTSLAHKEDPSTAKYDQNKMRQHLMDCFSNKFQNAIIQLCKLFMCFKMKISKDYLLL